MLSDAHFVFFNNLKSPEGTIEHMGDELEGGSGDDDDEDEEVIKVTWRGRRQRSPISSSPVSIYGAEENGQTFGQVSNAYIRIVDQPMAASLRAMTSPKTLRPRPRWCSVSCIAAVGGSGSSGRSGRGVRIRFGRDRARLRRERLALTAGGTIDADQRPDIFGGFMFFCAPSGGRLP